MHRSAFTRLAARVGSLTALLVACCLAGASLGAQSVLPRDRLVVYVFDAADGAPLTQATVTFTLEGEAQRRYTDEEGRFFVNVPLRGELVFEARRIGYKPGTAVATLPVRRNRVEINLERTGTTLAKVEVSAGPVFAGIVASSTTQLPIPGAVVSLTPGPGRMKTDSMGRFALPTDKRPDLTLTISAPGFAPRLVVDRLPSGESREMLILLDSISLVGNRLYQSLFDRDQRIRWRSQDAGAVGGRELRATAPGLADAIRFSQTYAAKGLVLDDAACLFVDGDPRPGQTLGSFPTDDVDVVEFYSARGEYLQVMMDRWPKFSPCGDGNPTRVRNRVAIVVVWTR